MSLNILLVDDHTLFREGLEGLLSRRDINVLAAVGIIRQGDGIIAVRVRVSLCNQTIIERVRVVVVLEYLHEGISYRKRPIRAPAVFVPCLPTNTMSSGPDLTIQGIGYFPATRYYF